MAASSISTTGATVLRARQTSAARRARAKLWDRIATGVLWGAAGIVTLTFLYIVVISIIKGWPALHAPGFLTSGLYTTGIAPQIFFTFYLLILALVMLVPVGIGAAIYMVEYASQGWTLRVLRFATETMTSLPSILVGFLGYLIFVTHNGNGHFLGFSPAAGALTLAVLNVPWMLRMAEDALRAVPRELREASMALGATRFKTVMRAVLPAAFPGLVTGILVVAGRIIAESAALLFTTTAPGGNGHDWFTLNPFTPGGETLAVHAYNLFAEPGGGDPTMLRLGSSLVLIILVLAFNVFARLLGTYINRRLVGKSA